ncbi:MAG: DNA adenine methylase, partial [Candidatus Binatia bacterium]
VVSYALKRLGKQVTCTDYLQFNSYIGHALIENSTETLTDADLAFVLQKDPEYPYESFITSTFREIYYTNDENAWLDVVVQNIDRLPFTKRTLAYYALFQACLVKRPFNLFHRKNLYIRFADVQRSFGNKSTWDRPFVEHFTDFVREINFLVFDNGKTNKAFHTDILDIKGSFDFVYLDPPYISSKNITVDYRDFYHFFEGVVNYRNWQRMIDYRSKHLRLISRPNPWNDKDLTRAAFRDTFDRFRDSIIAVSYRADGIPSIGEIQADLGLFKKRIRIFTSGQYKYVLSNSMGKEMLIIAE